MMKNMLEKFPLCGQKVLCIKDYSLFTKKGKVYKVIQYNDIDKYSLYIDDMNDRNDPDSISRDGLSHFILYDEN